MEFLLLNHPVDCPECDQAGVCSCRIYSYQHGKVIPALILKKRVPPRKDWTAGIADCHRCILCSVPLRPVYPGNHSTNELIVKQRGYKSEIDYFSRHFPE